MAVIVANNNKYVVVDEKDIGKSRIDLLIDLVYESTGTRFPQDKIRFGKPSELDQRPELYYDPNTYLPVNINIEFDRRFSTPVSGIMYRRLSLHEYLSKVDFESIKPEFFPFRISDLLDQINEQIPYALNMEDLVEYEYTSPDQWAGGIHITPHPESYVWQGPTVMVAVNTSAIGGGNLLDKHVLDGFNIYRAAGEPLPIPGFVTVHGPCDDPTCPVCNGLTDYDESQVDPRLVPYLRAINRPTNDAFKDGTKEQPTAPGSADYLNTLASADDVPPIVIPDDCGQCSSTKPQVDDPTLNPEYRVTYKPTKAGSGPCPVDVGDPYAGAGTAGGDCGCSA